MDVLGPPPEWVCRGNATRLSERLYTDFITGQLIDTHVMDVRLWAAMRSQSVAKTVIGAMRYSKALRELPNFQQHYRDQEDGIEESGPKEHAEVILAHQTFG